MTNNTEVTATITISIDEYHRLLDQDMWVNALDAAGVDNWEGYDEAVSILNEWKDD